MTNGNDSAHPIVPDITTANKTGLQMEFGLTKRELFAAMAMQGILENRAYYERSLGGKSVEGYAVHYADRLIAELNKEVQS